MNKLYIYIYDPRSSYPSLIYYCNRRQLGLGHLETINASKIAYICLSNLRENGIYIGLIGAFKIVIFNYFKFFKINNFFSTLLFHISHSTGLCYILFFEETVFERYCNMTDYKAS